MASFWEPEEAIGQLWHRLVGERHSYPAHPDAAVSFEAMRTRLGIVFRGLGGAGAVRLTAGGQEASGHRLTLLQRVGFGDTEKLAGARFDGGTLQLPESIDLFPDAADNAALYEWLTAWFAHVPPPLPPPADPLAADLVRLHQARLTTAATLHEWPGLRSMYGRLVLALLAVRPERRLPPVEAAVEAAVLGLLRGDEVRFSDLEASPSPPGYRPFLPVPLWGETVPPKPGRPTAESDSTGGDAAAGDQKRRKAKRRQSDQTRRDDPLMLNRFEKILGLAEMVNINRKTEDDDLENARKAADDLDEIALGQHDRKVATRLRLDLDLGVEGDDVEPLRAEATYPEWDWKRRAYLPHHCRVVAETAPTTGEAWRPDAAALRRIRLVRRQFEALRPRRQIMPAQSDGDELDLSALVRSLTDRKAGGPGSDRVYAAVRNQTRDLSVCVLMDVSLSTDAWIEDHRVLDVEKEALLALTHGLSACGDEHSVLTFTSRRRHWVGVHTVKDYDEPLSAAVARRIQALKPGQYTRMGAAIRHASAELQKRPQSRRLLLLLTDGKPNDTDHYEGRYAVEDTRMAVQEARRAGLKLFCVTVDEKGRDYLPYMFGPGAYAIFPHIARLPAALPSIYRHLTA